MHKEYEKKIMEKVDRMSKDDIIEYIKVYGSLMDEVLDYLKSTNKELYDEVECSLYEMAYGKTLSLEMAEKWVNNMTPRAKWSKAETDRVLDEYGLTLDPISFYVVMNMMYSDYGKSIGDNLEMYIKLARDFLKDDDAKENKLYCYWKNIVKR